MDGISTIQNLAFYSIASLFAWGVSERVYTALLLPSWLNLSLALGSAGVAIVFLLLKPRSNY